MNEDVDFEAMGINDMLQFRSDHDISIPMLGDLMTLDAQRLSRRKMKNLAYQYGVIQVPSGRHSFTIYTMQFESVLRRLVEEFYKDRKSTEAWEFYRSIVNDLTFQELVEFNSTRNFVDAAAIYALYEVEKKRGVPLHECTEHLRREGFTQAFTPYYVKDLRDAVIASINQKEKDFTNERP